MTSLALAAHRIAAWRRDPVLFVRENFGVEPDKWQVRALRFAAEGNTRAFRLALQACAGPGKSAVLAWLGWWALSCFGEPGHHPNGIAISMTGDNLRDGLWKELAVWRNRSSYLKRAFTWQKERIFANDHPETWFLSARSWSKGADQEALGRVLSGLHSKYIFYLIDESGSIPPALLKSAEQGLSNCEWGMIATAGNPSDHSSLLHYVVTEQSDLWDVVTITGDPDDPDRSPRIDKEWAREQIAQYGRDNPWVMAYILGKFPPSSLNVLLGPDDVRAAMKRSVPEDAYSNIQKRLGVDVARFGDDRTVIFPRQGLKAFKPVEMRNARTTDIAARIAIAKDKWHSELDFIDDTGGWAGGVIDQCLLAKINLMPINFSSTANDPRYFNIRSEMYFKAAEWVKSGGELPDVPGLVKEATAAKYWFENGKLRVQEKEQIKKDLGGQSPDLWDALLLTFAMPDMPASVESILGTGVTRAMGRAATEYDPYAEDREYVGV